MPYAYNSFKNSAFGKIKGVKNLNPEGWKTNKAVYMRTPAKTKFYQNEVNYSYGDGFIYPFIVSLREMIEITEDNRVRWKNDMDIFRFVDDTLPKIMNSGFVSFMRGLNYDPAKVGKEGGSYDYVANFYKVAEHIPSVKN